MVRHDEAPGGRDKLLFTPGPLTTSARVKRAMLRDLGSRDAEFLAVVRQVRAGLLRIAGVAEPDWTALPGHGSGTYAIEATLGTLIPREGRLLVAHIGAYGERIVRLARALHIAVQSIDVAEDAPLSADAIGRALDADPTIGFVAVVHCETSTGQINPIPDIASAVHARGRRLIVDAMSSFGAVPLDLSLASSPIDALITSANKCLEGVPGFALVLCRRALITAASGQARGISLDLSAQLAGLDRDGQFRFTPPTHALLALHEALRALDDEGGPAARLRRYDENARILRDGMAALGFRTFLSADRLSPIITSYMLPTHPRFDFAAFYGRLSDRGFVLYPGKVSRADCFRIGTIGQIFPDDVRRLLAAIADVLASLGITPPLP